MAGQFIMGYVTSPLLTVQLTPIWNWQLLLQQCAPLHGLNPPWSLVMIGISAFVLQYAASGGLEVPLLYQAVAGVPALDTLLCGTALLHWYAFDRSPQGEHCAFMTLAIINIPISICQIWKVPNM